MKKEDIVNVFLKHQCLVSPDFLVDYDGNEEFFRVMPSKDGPTIINKDLFFLLKNANSIADINWMEFEKSRALLEKGKDERIYQTFLDILSYNIMPEKRKILETIQEEITKEEENISLEKESSVGDVIVSKVYLEEENKKREVDNFIQYFKLRYQALKDILLQRQELQTAVSPHRLAGKKNREMVSVIGLVRDKMQTKNGHILLTLEDPTGSAKVIVSKTRSDLLSVAKDVVLDGVVGVVAMKSDDVLFAQQIYFPDIPPTKEIKKCDDDVWAAFTSDVHVGSVYFLEKEFIYFIDWLNGGYPSVYPDIVNKIKYLFFLGDLVDGIGIYPGQENKIAIRDVKGQYTSLAAYLKKIKPNINLILCPGNHDAVRISQPQPKLDKKYAFALYDLANVTLVTNPPLITIHASAQFSGFDVLMFHGNSYHYYMENIESLLMANTKDNPKHIMKFILKQRHLAPTHSSALYVPDIREDPLVIQKVPDIFVSGELHRPDISSYNNVVTINCSCWQAPTEFEIKTGNNPDPCKVVVMNLKTRETRILDFTNHEKIF